MKPVEMGVCDVDPKELALETVLQSVCGLHRSLSLAEVDLGSLSGGVWVGPEILGVTSIYLSLQWPA